LPNKFLYHIVKKQNNLMENNFIKYIGFILLIAIIGIFIHSEIIEYGHSHEINDAYDYCDLVSNTIQPQQYEYQKINNLFNVALPFFEYLALFENTNSEIFTIPQTPVKNISRTILFQSFLI